MRSEMVSRTISPRPLSLSEPQLGGNEWRYLKECLDSGWVSSVGPFVERFEREMAAYVGTTHAVAVVNGTAALHIALLIAGVQPGDEVVVPTLTFIAAVNAIRYCGAEPVFMDSDPQTWQLDVERCEQFLARECRSTTEGCVNTMSGRRVRAILPVHLLGLACEMDRLVELARRYGLNVVEDAAEAVGVRYRGRHAGTFGDIGVLSFNGNKVMTTGGGGMLVTNESSIAARARYLTTQAKDDPSEYIHHEVGYNYRLTNLQAALGVAQLEQLDSFIMRKRRIARDYAERLRPLQQDGLTLMPEPAHTEATYWLYTVLLGADTTRARRQNVIRHLNSEGIGARPLWHPVHRLRPYAACQAFEIEWADRLYERALSLPSSVGLEEAEVERCVEALRRALSYKGRS